VGELFGQLKFHDGIVAVMDMLRASNQLVQEEQPWSLGRTDPGRRDWVVGQVLESLRVAGVLMQPVLPATAARLLDRLGVEGRDRAWSQAVPRLPGLSRPLGEDTGVLFVKVKYSKEEETADVHVSKTKPKKKRKEKLE
jgi:methionyl-tRNA synthetase